MTQEPKERWAFSISGSGDDTKSTFHLYLVRYRDGEPTDECVVYDGVVKLDGDPYGPAEWIREVLMSVVESF